MPFRKKLLFHALLAITLTNCVWANDPRANQKSVFQVKRIAHAGGGLGDLTYTNSYQALEKNLEKKGLNILKSISSLPVTTTLSAFMTGKGTLNGLSVLRSRGPFPLMSSSG